MMWYYTRNYIADENVFLEMFRFTREPYSSRKLKSFAVFGCDYRFGSFWSSYAFAIDGYLTIRAAVYMLLQSLLLVTLLHGFYVARYFPFVHFWCAVLCLCALARWGMDFGEAAANARMHASLLLNIYITYRGPSLMGQIDSATQFSALGISRSASSHITSTIQVA